VSTPPSERRFRVDGRGERGGGAVRAYLGLGANLGDRAANLRAAVQRLEAGGELAVAARSRLWETEPQGVRDQPWFLNAAVAVRTRLSPRRLLERCLAVEASLGRERSTRWGPRPVDVDILLYGDAVLAEPDLVIPHPRLHQRAFALAPLCDLDPDLAVPGRGSVRELLAAALAVPGQAVWPTGEWL
jgi:2-amino-4-hydroxy-6-hydroxymethyldihydropteridine diphosphokinase